MEGQIIILGIALAGIVWFCWRMNNPKGNRTEDEIRNDTKLLKELMVERFKPLRDTELCGFDISKGNSEFESQLRDVYLKIFPDGQKQINLEAESLWNNLNKKYTLSKVIEIYTHASCVYYAYCINGNGCLSRVDEMYFFSSIRDKYSLPRIDMLIIYEELKAKPEININHNLQNQHKDVFKEHIVNAFEIYLKDKMEKSEFLSYGDAKKKLSIQIAIVEIWRHLYNADFNQFIEDTNLTEIDLKNIIDEVRDEMRDKIAKKYR